MSAASHTWRPSNPSILGLPLIFRGRERDLFHCSHSFQLCHSFSFDNFRVYETCQHIEQISSKINFLVDQYRVAVSSFTVAKTSQ